jgi:hypothetical protein
MKRKKRNNDDRPARGVVIAAAFALAFLLFSGCASPTGVEGESMWWPQAVGWSWLYVATDQGDLEFDVKIEDTAEYGDRECFVNEFGDYDNHDGMLVAVRPASDEAFEIWDQKVWVDMGGGWWVEMELRYTDPLTAHISGTLDDPVTDDAAGDIYVNGIPVGQDFTATLTSETLETGVEMEVQGETHSDMRRVEFTLESDVQDPVTSHGYFERGVGLVRGEGLWGYGVLELVSYETP